MKKNLYDFHKPQRIKIYMYVILTGDYFTIVVRNINMSNPPTVLIIEDSSTQAKRIAMQLSAYDINVVLAEDGLQGLRLVDAYHPDLIVLDINLPRMDGYQVCHRLKRDESTRHIPIIMLTTNDSSEDALRGLSVGADDYIAKDIFASEHLLSALATLGFLDTHKGI